MRTEGADRPQGPEGLDATQREVLAFWFGEDLGAGDTPPRPQWFTKDAAFDVRIVARFGSLIDSALAGRCEHWLDSPLSALAYVIVLDQFTRNAFRDTPRAFAGDDRALAAARRIVDAGWDQHLAPLQRMFCYMPFEHSERLPDQERSLQLFGALREDPQAGGAWPWAQSHHAVIARFGRFPHRNEILGRESSPQERAFLATPGSRF